MFILITVFPIFWALVSSLRSDEEIFRYAMPFSWRTFVPDKLTFQSYINVFVEKHFGKVLFNTIFVGVATIVTGIIVNAVAGFIFAKYTFRFKRLLFFLVVLSFMVPFEAVSIPLYKTITVLKWENTYIALILPTVANGLVIFLFKQFFEEIPNSLMESATVEGAGMFTIFTKIVIPNSIPVMVSAGLMIFMWQWESFLWPLIVARNENVRMVQVALTDFQTQYSMLWSEMLAACLVSAAVPIIFLAPLQKYYIQGIVGAGIKE